MGTETAVNCGSIDPCLKSEDLRVPTGGRHAGETGCGRSQVLASDGLASDGKSVSAMPR